MSDFFNLIFDANFAFIRYAVLAGILSSVAFGIVGAFVVTRRISYIAGGIAHSILGGIGLALFLQVNYKAMWFHPILGAAMAAVISALIIGWSGIRSNQRSDTVIGAIWALGMAAGLIFIAKTPGYVDPMSYLFGNILLISGTDLWLIFGLDVVITAAGVYFYNVLQALSFDEEFTKLRGINTGLFHMILLIMTALTVVMLVRIVGIVLVIALLTLPPAAAGLFTKTLKQMMAAAVGFCMLFILLGIYLSFVLNLPTGPVIIVIAGVFYLAGAGIRRNN